MPGPPDPNGLGLRGLGPQASEQAREKSDGEGEESMGLSGWLGIIYGLLSVAFRAEKKAYRNRNPREIARRRSVLRVSCELVFASQ